MTSDPSDIDRLLSELCHAEPFHEQRLRDAAAALTERLRADFTEQTRGIVWYDSAAAMPVLSAADFEAAFDPQRHELRRIMTPRYVTDVADLRGDQRDELKLAVTTPSAILPLPVYLRAGMPAARMADCFKVLAADLVKELHSAFVKAPKLHSDFKATSSCGEPCRLCFLSQPTLYLKREMFMLEMSAYVEAAALKAAPATAELDALAALPASQ